MKIKMRDHHFKLTPLCQALALIAMLPEPYAFAAANFNIRPDGALPTTVPAGGSVSANYIVTNLTHSARRGYRVEGLPPTVTQATGAGLCASPIELNSQQSCQLALTITGEAKSNFAICLGASCTTASVPLNVSVTSSPPVPPLPPVPYLLVGGAYTATGNNFFPLLAARAPSATTWSYPASILSNLPSYLNTTTGHNGFFSTSCSDNFCIAAGFGEEAFGLTTAASAPLVAQSIDAGATWTYPSGTLPDDLQPRHDFANDRFYSSSCTGLTCVAVGNYVDNTDVNPLISKSTDGGATWGVVSLASILPPDFSSSGYLYSVSCSGTACFAAGRYNSGSLPFQRFLLTKSADAGVSWAGVTVTGPFNWFELGIFKSISCNGTVCNAVGSYLAFDFNVYPCIAHTNDGVNWTFTYDSTTAPTDFTNTNDGFNSVSCSGPICVAGGSYISLISGQTSLLLAQSLDGGQSWSNVVDSTHLVPSNYGSSAVFLAVKCTGTLCIAAGSYFTALGVQVPVMMQNSLVGLPGWQIEVDDSPALRPPGFLDQGTFWTADCSAETCFAAGKYSDDGASIWPVLIETTDAGATWHYSIYNNPATLPSNFTSLGTFCGPGFNSQDCIP